jgi:tripartite ATP-independent transporter DctP family solute receptor
LTGLLNGILFFTFREEAMKKANGIVAITALLAATGAMSFAAVAADFTLRVNVIQSKSEPVYKGFEVFKKYVESASKGKIDVELFDSTQLGGQGTLVLDLGQGQYDMSATSPAAMAAVTPSAGVLNAPYMFRSPQQMLAALNSDVAKGIFKQFESDANVKVLDAWYYGTRELTSNILGTTPEELSSVRMRIYDAPIAYEFAYALGTKPTVVAFSELYLALKTGTVDAEENPIPTIEAQKFYEAQKYLILTDHVIAPTLPMINLDKWKALSPDLQKIVVEGLKKGGELNDKLVRDGESGLIAKLKEQGMTVVKPKSLDPFRKRAEEHYKKYESAWGAGTYQKLQAIGE